MLIRAQVLNPIFQNDCAKLERHINIAFQRINKQYFENNVDKKLKCVYQGAPVKLAERSQVKASTDYAQMPWPHSAQIVDLVRCSFTFTNCEALLMGLKVFKDMVDKVHHKTNRVNQFGTNQLKFDKTTSRNTGFASLKKIVRIKNMFSEIDDWTDLNKIQYCDVKFNVIIMHFAPKYDSKTKQTTITPQCIIGEVCTVFYFDKKINLVNMHDMR